MEAQSETIAVEYATAEHVKFAQRVCELIYESAQERGTGIAKRTPEYIASKIEGGKAVVALAGDKLVGFSYIESWEHEEFVATSGLIVDPAYRQRGLARRIKQKTFELAQLRFPGAKLFSITTSMPVMKLNSELGYKPVTFANLTNDDAFWEGCQGCCNYDILQRNNRRMCLCTGMLWAKKKKVLLAFSGGLDTSFTVKYLSHELGYEVHTAIANTGGFSAEELKAIEERAYALGAASHATLDVTEEYYSKSIRYMIAGNVLRGGTYPISVSSERIFQAMATIEYAKKLGVDAIAHGSTGAGNDQVRFDLTFQIMAPEIEIITPTRDLTLTREYEINYLKEHGYEADFKKMAYSINKGLWGTSIGGKETLRSEQTLPEEAYPSQITAEGTESLKLTFSKGELTAVNGMVYENKVEAIRAVEAIASRYGIGRDMHIGDTIIGIKGRVGFEAAAPIVIIAAHKMLEKHTLTKWQQYWKDQVGTWYGMFLHEAQYLEPVMRDIEAMLASSQQNVTGVVEVMLRPYSYQLVGVDSPYDLMKTDFGEYGEINKAWTADDVKGFTKILGNQMKIFYNIQNKNK